MAKFRAPLPKERKPWAMQPFSTPCRGFPASRRNDFVFDVSMSNDLPEPHSTAERIGEILVSRKYGNIGPISAWEREGSGFGLDRGSLRGGPDPRVRYEPRSLIPVYCKILRIRRTTRRQIRAQGGLGMGCR